MSLVQKAPPAVRKVGPDFVQSLARGLSVIEAFSEENQELTLSAVATRAGISRAAARRLLLTLHQLGYVGFDGKYFWLKPRVLGLGYAYLSSMNLAEVAETYMREVVEKVHESCSASVLDGTEIVYVARVPTRRIMTISLNVGSRLAAYCTSMGRVLLAGQSPEQINEYLKHAELRKLTPKTVVNKRELRRILDQVREDQFAVVDQELEEGVRSVAVPIFGRKGVVIAAINCSAHASRVSMTELVTRFLPPLKQAATRTQESLSRHQYR